MAEEVQSTTPVPFQRPRAATLAVGTEVTDGQITDRNSAWISQKLVRAGVQVIEHRAVADDRADIDRALRELSERVDYLFVTGGLGPTSDDFTRDVLASHFGLPLEYHEKSWRQINEKAKARGARVSNTQIQQCYYPRGSRVLDNPAGTANAFSFDAMIGARRLRVYALPGPPAEIAAVWEINLAVEIETLVAEASRERLRIYRCLGKGEGELADLVEEALKGSGLRIGYRAHVPYVEIKLWMTNAEETGAREALQRLEQMIAPWIVNRDDEDLADAFIDRVQAIGKPVVVRDFASAGALQDRVIERLKERKMYDRDLPLSVETSFVLGGSASGKQAAVGSGASPGMVVISLWADEPEKLWRLSMNEVGAARELEIKPPSIYNFRSERARRYIAERALHALVTQVFPV